ncbi:hypothetical protein FHG87_018273 [Trinorchestia longiramus]|nr:hypothetical protein FHG87_018273 [Trinorchestia longiramus]
MSNSPTPTHVDEALRWLVHDYIDDAILGLTFEVHRALKAGLVEAELGDRTDENQYLQVNVEGLDVFGQAPIKKSHECVCPNCSRSLAASRYLFRRVLAYGWCYACYLGYLTAILLQLDICFGMCCLQLVVGGNWEITKSELYFHYNGGKLSLGILKPLV